MNAINLISEHASLKFPQDRYMYSNKNNPYKFYIEFKTIPEQ